MDNRPYGVIYKILNKIDGSLYIGQTIQELKKRFAVHICKKSNCSYISKAIQKYGKENFEIKIIARCDSLEEMNHRESYYIKLFNTLAPNGYNLNTGGLNRLASDLTKKKMSNSLKGKKRSEESKKRISESQKGKKNSQESNKKRSKALMGNKNHNFGKKFSKETLIKMSESRNHKKKKVFCPELNIVFESIRDTSKKTGIHRFIILSIINKKQKQSKGLTFSLVEKE